MEKIEPGEMVRRLTGFIRTEGRFDSVAIENFRKMPGGASREIWSFDCAMERGGETNRRAMVLRRDPGAHNVSTSRRHEFMVIRAVFEERIPVPEVFWVSEDPAVLGSAFFIMERIDGETLARRLLRDDAYARAREVMPAQLAEILAKIHRIDPVKHKLDFLAEPGDNAALSEVKRYEETFRLLALEPHPAFELCLHQAAHGARLELTADPAVSDELSESQARSRRPASRRQHLNAFQRFLDPGSGVEATSSSCEAAANATGNIACQNSRSRQLHA